MLSEISYDSGQTSRLRSRPSERRVEWLFDNDVSLVHPEIFSWVNLSERRVKWLFDNDVSLVHPEIFSWVNLCHNSRWSVSGMDNK
jgi:hypothetical protein